MVHGEAKQWRDTVATTNQSHVHSRIRLAAAGYARTNSLCACLTNRLTFTVSKGWPTINPAAPEAWNSKVNLAQIPMSLGYVLNRMSTLH